MNSKSLLNRIFALVLAIVVAFFCFGIESFAATAEETTYKESLKAAGFPNIYLDKLWSMHQLHPTWKFVAYNTNLDWDAAVKAESAAGKNLVYIQPNSSYSATRLYTSRSVGSYISKAGFDYDFVIRDGSDSAQKGWTDASPMAVAYYMNPYTFIGSDITIMQFESLEWNFGSVDVAVPIIETMLTGTFMSKTRNSVNVNYVDDSGNITYKNTTGGTVGTDESYAHAICQAAKDNNINPCYLTAKILGEVGSSGSGSTTGTNGTYPGYYNYLNVGANDSGNGAAVENGLANAKKSGWSSPMLSISGGAKFIASSYIAVGQNTSYLQKFNVTSQNTYSHQYMTAVNGVVNTTYSTYSGYKKNGILEAEKTFYIPVFKNMPSSLSNSITTSGYTNSASASTTVTIRNNVGVDFTSVGSLSKGQSVTIYGGFRDQRVAYDASKGTDSTMYRMMTPLWYKIADGKYVCEDYINTNASATIKIGGTTKFKYTLSSGSENPRFMSWDTRIATVDSSGNIRGVSMGSTKVVAYLVNGSFAVINVNVQTDAAGVPSAISSPTYGVNNAGSLISKVAIGTSAGTFKNGLNEKSFVKITKNGTEMSSSDVITTGCVASIMNGSQVVKSYTIVVTGDIGANGGLGDGKVSISDLLLIRDELLSSTGILSGANYKAADINGDGKVTISDLLAIRDYLLGSAGITPRSY